MIESTPPSTRLERRPPRRRRRWLKPLIWLVVVAAVFAAGLALGEALHDNPTGGTQTLVRTLKPLPVPPAPETVTVTTGR